MMLPEMMPVWLGAPLALFFGLITAIVLNRTLRMALLERPEDFPSAPAKPSSPAFPAPVGFPTPQVGRPLETANLAILGAGSVVLALSPLGHSPFELFQGLLMFMLLYPLALLDLLTQLLESPLIIAGLALRLGALALLKHEDLVEAVTGMLVGAGALYLVGFIYEALRGRQGLGDGDPALMALIGAFVGWRNLAAVLLIAAALGLLVGYPLLRLRGAAFSTPIPFAPFLCLGGFVIYLMARMGPPWL